MKINVLFFAICRELAKTGKAEIELPDGADRESLWKTLLRRYPAMSDLAPRIAIAVNNRFVKNRLELSDGDIVSLIPPVSGG